MMKTFLGMLAFAALFVATGCARAVDGADYGNAAAHTALHGGIADDAVIVLEEPYFEELLQEIQFNRRQFLGRTVQLSGAFFSLEWGDEIVYTVARPSQGCCGAHRPEVYLNDFAPLADNTWVEVTGILEEFYVEEFGFYLPRVSVVSMVLR